VKVKEENDVYDRLDEIIGKINEKDSIETIIRLFTEITQTKCLNLQKIKILYQKTSSNIK